MSFPRQFICDFVLVLVVSTAALLFLPAAHGPYSATHGPVTSLLRAETKPGTTYSASIQAVARDFKRRSFVGDCTPGVFIKRRLRHTRIDDTPN